MIGGEQPGMVGRKFGQYAVRGYDAATSLMTGRDHYFCRCDCTREKSVRGLNLRNGNSQSCGCYQSDIDLMSQKFGRWRVVRELSTRIHGEVAWLCKCDCSEERVVRGDSLRSGKSQSCGCYRDDAARERMTGESGPGYTDGAHTATIKFYNEMRRRDKYTCQRCNKTQEAEIKDTGRQLHIHHKDSNHYNDVPSNIQTLCNSCHSTIEREIRSMNKSDELDFVYNTDEYDFESLKDILI